VWLRIYQPDGSDLYKGMLRAGERYQVPAGAAAPMIRTGRPNALQISIGATQIPPLGEPERVISDVSLKPADLLARAQGGAQPGFAPGPVAPGPAVPPPAAPAQ
jgi:cytoskeleton protein RodZ